MVEAFASVPDLLRLAALPGLGWAAWRDHRTRRVPGRLWWPLVGLGIVLLAWEGYEAVGRSALAGRLFLLRAGISVGLLVPLAVAFYRFHLVGGADAKAFVALAVLFPTYPTYHLGVTVLPLVRPPLGVLSLSAVTNGALIGLFYPAWLVARNAVAGAWSPAMVRAKRVPWTALPTTHGRLAETPEGRTLGGLDLDALRMYLRWRKRSLVDLRERPAALRDPTTVPAEPGAPTDGRVDPAEATDTDRSVDAPAPDGVSASREPDDPWAAEAFLGSVDDAYGTTPDQLRAGLELLSHADRVWVSPGLPYLVPVVAGVVLALTYGDLLYAGLRAVGLG
ncbi:MAG: prepilin peptidase [Halobacteriales archaeon]